MQSQQLTNTLWVQEDRDGHADRVFPYVHTHATSLIPRGVHLANQCPSGRRNLFVCEMCPAVELENIASLSSKSLIWSTTKGAGLYRQSRSLIQYQNIGLDWRLGNFALSWGPHLGLSPVGAFADWLTFFALCNARLSSSKKNWSLPT